MVENTIKWYKIFNTKKFTITLDKLLEISLEIHTYLQQLCKLIYTIQKIISKIIQIIPIYIKIQDQMLIV